MKLGNTSLHKMPSLSLGDLKSHYAKSRTKIKRRLEDFRRVKPEKYFYELIYCLLTPQTSALNADSVVKALESKNFQKRNFDPERFLSKKATYIRFHKNKSKYLIEMKSEYAQIFQHLKNSSSPLELREWLVKNVKGIGYKEASHFLRNIGYRNLAILDRHILKNLVRIGVIDSIPKTLTRTNYLEIEKKFLRFAHKVKIPMDELDLLFWSIETGKVFK